MVTAAGQPVEFFLTPSFCADVTSLQWFDFELPAGAEIYTGKAYNDYRVRAD